MSRPLKTHASPTRPAPGHRAHPTPAGCSTRHRAQVPPRHRMRRGLAIGALAATCLALTPAAMAQEPAIDIVPAVVTAAAPAVAVPAVMPAAAPAAAPAAMPAAAPEAVLGARRAAFLHFTTASPEATDRRGVEPSLYRGRFYRSSVERVRLCIVRRESEGIYTVRGGGGNRYYGAYQMNDDLADGATWMMLPEAKQLLGESVARALMAQLRETPVTRWSRYWQDAAFFTIYNWERPGSGREHWAGGRWHC